MLKSLIEDDRKIVLRGIIQFSGEEYSLPHFDESEIRFQKIKKLCLPIPIVYLTVKLIYEKNSMVLIVDDNMNFINRMIGLLEDVENIGHIKSATNYDEACRLLETETPDVALLDINMPGKNGIELLKYIKHNNMTCEVIMITNHADTYYRQQCEELGAKHFLDKSNDFGLVPGMIKELLKRK